WVSCKQYRGFRAACLLSTCSIQQKVSRARGSKKYQATCKKIDSVEYFILCAGCSPFSQAETRLVSLQKKKTLLAWICLKGKEKWYGPNK
ncbi:MAG TPA: hypothetical protein VFV38_33245, partial [Ktedonobacteraceae bacterium]|nr:hypothetical protein [Ktedonobacteraceae bacterium]